MFFFIWVNREEVVVTDLENVGLLGRIRVGGLELEVAVGDGQPGSPVGTPGNVRNRPLVRLGGIPEIE